MPRSLLLSLMFTAIMLLSRTLQGGWSFESFNLEFPYNVWYTVLGVFAYGSLEVFFVVWLVVNTDKAINGHGSVMSPGLLTPAIVFGLVHIVFSPQGGILNAIRVAGEFLVLGLIFNYTGNSIGPIIAWTLINGQILYLL